MEYQYIYKKVSFRGQYGDFFVPKIKESTLIYAASAAASSAAVTEEKPSRNR